MGTLAAVPTGSEVDPCCCGTACNVIPVSLCGSVAKKCSWYPEFTDPGADPPIVASCPPKFYRKKTIEYVRTETTRYSSSGNPVSKISEGSLTETFEIDSECVETKACVAGSATSTDYNTSGDATAVCESAITGIVTEFETCEWEGTVSFPLEPETPPAEIDVPCSGAFLDAVSMTVLSPTVAYREIVEESTFVSRFRSVRVTLSDEVSLFEELAEKVCDTEPCDSDDEEPGCGLCCTDRGGLISGERYLDTPEGCITPGSSLIAWDASPCNTSGTRAGQSVELALWFKDLEPGTTYKATVTYKRCGFELDGESETIYPSGCVAGSCEDPDPENWDTITDEVTFTAEHWAEILAPNCGLCRILRKKCELEDEANDWNTANPEATPRSVACTEGGFTIPTAHETYTWFHSCELQVVPPEEP